MKLFIFEFKVSHSSRIQGHADAYKEHHRFKLVANDHKEAIEFLKGTAQFRFFERQCLARDEDMASIALGLKTPTIIDKPTLVDSDFDIVDR